MLLTKYVVGAKANPPKNPRRPPKKGKQMPINIVNAERRSEICINVGTYTIKMQTNPNANNAYLLTNI